jgi:2',3'-cyclic-nucleotide 2'-phosphodiesterase (5'-nucleotidase family)
MLLWLAMVSMLSPAWAALANPPASPPAPERTANTLVTVAWQCGVRGRISSTCSRYTCQGGLARRATCIDSLRGYDPRLLLIDGGDFFAENDTVNRALDLMVWQEMERLRYDVVVLGDNELQQWELLDPLLADSTLPIVCTNAELLRNGMWQPIGRRSRIVTVGGIRVGILSAVVADSVSARSADRILRANSWLLGNLFKSAGGRLRLLPVVETCREEARRLRSRADVVLLVANLPGKLMERIAREVPEIDVIFGGSEIEPDAGPPAGRIGRTVVHRDYTGGTRVAVTQLSVAPHGIIASYDGSPVVLGPGMAEDAEVDAAVRRAREAWAEASRQRRER